MRLFLALIGKRSRLMAAIMWTSTMKIRLIDFMIFFPDEDLPNDPYKNYLLCPHFHFSGTFLADPPTGNNIYSNLNPEKFNQSDMSWNPKGSGEWSVSATVTGICYTNGDWVESGGEDNANDDPILGAPVLGKNGPRNVLYGL